MGAPLRATPLSAVRDQPVDKSVVMSKLENEVHKLLLNLESRVVTLTSTGLEHRHRVRRLSIHFDEFKLYQFRGSKQVSVRNRSEVDARYWTKWMVIESILSGSQGKSLARGEQLIWQQARRHEISDALLASWFECLHEAKPKMGLLRQRGCRRVILG